LSENILPIKDIDKNSLIVMINQIYEDLFFKNKNISEEILNSDINKYIDNNLLTNKSFVILLLFNYLLLIIQCNDKKITRKQLILNLKTFMNFEKSTERTNIDCNGNNNSQNPKSKENTPKRRVKSKEERIAEEENRLSRMRKKLSKLSYNITKLNKKIEKEKGEVKKMKKKISNPKELKNQDLLERLLEESDADFGDENEEDTDIIEHFEKVEDEPAYQKEEGAVISGGLGILEEKEEKIELPDIADYKNYKICKEETTRFNINVSIEKIKLTQNNIIDSSGVYHPAPIEDIGPKKSKFTWNSIATFIIAFVGLSLPLSRIAKMIHIPGVLKRMTGTALAEIVEKQVKNFIPIYEQIFKLFAEMAYINTDDHPAQNEEHDTYMKKVRDLNSNYPQHLLKKDKSMLEEYLKKLREIPKPWDYFKDEESSLSSLKTLENLEEEKIRKNLEEKEKIAISKQMGNHTPDQENLLNTKRENMRFERGKRKIEISSKLSSFLGFESQCKTENIYFTGFKTSLNLTVMTGKLDIHNPQSRLVFFRTHLGSAGNLLNQVFARRTKLLSGEEKTVISVILPQEITIQADCSSNNLIDPEYQKDAIYVGCLAHLRRYFIKESKLIPNFKKLAAEAEEKSDYHLEIELAQKNDPENLKQLRILRNYNKIYSLKIILEELEFLMSELELELKGFTRENMIKYREECQKSFVTLCQSFDIFEDYWEENSNFMKGCKYFRANMLSFFNIYCDPYVSLTNNISERLLRSPVLLEKAQSRRKSYSSAFVLDVFRSIVATCEASKVPVREYIIAILKADYHDILSNPTYYLPHVMKERLQK